MIGISKIYFDKEKEIFAGNKSYIIKQKFFTILLFLYYLGMSVYPIIISLHIDYEKAKD